MTHLSVINRGIVRINGDASPPTQTEIYRGREGERHLVLLASRGLVTFANLEAFPQQHNGTLMLALLVALKAEIVAQHRQVAPLQRHEAAQIHRYVHHNDCAIPEAG